MNSFDLDEIINEIEKTSYYNMVSMKNNYLFKKIVIQTIIIMSLLIPIEIFLLLKFNLYNIDAIMPLFALTFCVVLIPPTYFTTKKLTKNYILEYNNNHATSYTTFNEIRFNEFYNCILKNYSLVFLDNIFNILIPYIEAKEKQLSKDPEYSSKIIALISVLVGLFASIVGGIIPLIVQKLDIKYQLLVLFIAVSIIWLIYSVIMKILTFQTKSKKMKKSLKDIKVFLYNSKLRYELEHQKESLNDSNAGLKNTKENSPEIFTSNENLKERVKTKSHKILDILFQ